MRLPSKFLSGSIFGRCAGVPGVRPLEGSDLTRCKFVSVWRSFGGFLAFFFEPLHVPAPRQRAKRAAGGWRVPCLNINNGNELDKRFFLQKGLNDLPPALGCPPSAVPEGGLSKANSGERR